MKLLAIDGNSIMNRAFYGIKTLANSKGQFTNAITGFMNIYLKEISQVQPDCVAVAFDLRAPTFRHKANADYKANRKGMPDELAQQMPVIKELLGDLGVKVVECEGYEADDILGTLSKACADSGNECFILTGDRDSFQLVSDSVTVRLAGTKETKIYTPERIMEEYGVSPRQMIEVKALAGDKSDNYDGVTGIGDTWALRLIQQAGSVDALYKNLDELNLTPNIKAKLENGHQDALDSRFLAEIFLQVPIDTDIESYKLGGGDREKTRELLAGLEMFKLLERLGGQGAFSGEQIEPEKKIKLSDLPKITEKTLESGDIAAFEQAGKIGAELKDGTLRVICADTVYTTQDKDLILSVLGSKCAKYAFEGKSLHLFASPVSKTSFSAATSQATCSTRSRATTPLKICASLIKSLTAATAVRTQTSQVLCRCARTCKSSLNRRRCPGFTTTSSCRFARCWRQWSTMA